MTLSNKNQLPKSIKTALAWSCSRPTSLSSHYPFKIKESCPLMTCALRLAAGRPGLVLDVRANGGCESNLALMAGRKVIAVECLASAYWELLQEPRLRSHQNLTLLHTCAGAVVNITT